VQKQFSYLIWTIIVLWVSIIPQDFVEVLSPTRSHKLATTRSHKIPQDPTGSHSNDIADTQRIIFSTNIFYEKKGEK